MHLTRICSLLRKNKFSRVVKEYSQFMRTNTSLATKYILGIETSCDDTGCAIINGEGRLLAEVLQSQKVVHLRNGGIIPDVAQDLHRANIESVISKTLSKADLKMENITAISVTVKPGLPLSLAIGMKYAKHLAKSYKKPLIPIHHMEAHALTARMEHNIPFPFLVLLISGGHCLLAVAQDVNNFQLLGQSIDCAPGYVFDKVARRMKLKNLREYSKICGGQAVEILAAKATDPHQFKLPLPLVEYKDCNFSFNGLKTAVELQLVRKEKIHNIKADKLIPEISDLCAAMLLAVSRHLVHRTQRAMEFCHQQNLIPENNKQLVVSGGVACNNIIFNALSTLCEESEYKIFRPAPKLCTDNGVMIAWNGLEKFKRNIDIMEEFSSLDIEADSPLGHNLIPKVIESNIPMKLLKLKLKT